jgi:hypothetical protein
MLRVAVMLGAKLLPSWTASRDASGLARYEVRLTATGVRATVFKVAGSKRSALLTRLVRGKTYSVSVRAVDKYGNASGWSSALRGRAR